MANALQTGSADDSNVDYYWGNLEFPEIEPFFKSLPKKDSSTIRIFNRTNCYTLFGADAVFVGLHIRKTAETIRNYNVTDEEGHLLVPYANFSEVQFNALIKELIMLHNMKVQMYNKPNNNWILEYEASPGNLPEQLEDLFYDHNSHLDAKGVLAVHFNSKQLNQAVKALAKEMSSGGQTYVTATNEKSDSIPFAVAYIDTLGKQIKLATAFDHPVHLSAIESLMVQLAPREVIVSENNECIVNRLKDIAPSFISHIDTARSKNFDSGILNYLADFLVKSDVHMIEAIFNSLDGSAKTLTLESLNAAVQFLELEHNSSNFKQFTIELLNIPDLVRLDSAAISSLNLFISRSTFGTFGSYNNQQQTVFGLLNKCKTKTGQALLSQWIRQPLYNLQKLLDRQQFVDFFVRNSKGRTTLHPKLSILPDLSRLSRRLTMKTGTLSDLYSTYLGINTIKDVLYLLDEVVEEDPNGSKCIKESFIKPFTKCQEDLNDLKVMIMDIIDLPYWRSHKELRISASFDKELAGFQEESKTLEEQLDRLHRTAIRDTEIEALKLLQATDRSYFFACTKKSEGNVKRVSRSYQLITSTKKDQSRFTCDALEKLNPKLQSITKKYRKRESELMSDICDKVAEFSHLIRSLNDIFALLDVFLSLAVAAVSFNIPWVKPKLLASERNILQFKQLRHPCIEAESEDPYIPNDVNLSEKRLLVLTGPNMGGKSTYIRSIGIAVLLAQIGSFIPADEAVVSIVDGIYTRIGAGDRQLQGNSTFMAEMVETSSILRSASEKSLIMIDELGRGTSTYDGFGIAWAVAHHIATKLKSFCLFASHFFELTKLEDELSCVGNLHVSVFINPENQEVKMTYKIKEGKCLKSYGVIMAKAAEFPEEIITTANEKLQDLECEFEGKRINAKKAFEELKEKDLKDLPDEELGKMVNSIILKYVE